MTQLQALNDCRIYVGFGRLEGDDRAIRRILLSEERSMAVMSKAHPLASASAPLKLREMLLETLIVYAGTPRVCWKASGFVAIMRRAHLRAHDI